MPNWLPKNCHFLKIPFLYYFSMSRITHHFQMNTQSAVTIILMKVAHKTYSNQKQFNLSLIFFVSAFTLDWYVTTAWRYSTIWPTNLKEHQYLRMTIGKLTKIKTVVLFSATLIFSLMSYYEAPVTVPCLEQYLTSA